MATTPQHETSFRCVEKSITISPRQFALLHAAMRVAGESSLSRMIGRIIDQAHAVKVPLLKDVEVGK